MRIDLDSRGSPVVVPPADIAASSPKARSTSIIHKGPVIEASSENDYSVNDIAIDAREIVDADVVASSPKARSTSIVHKGPVVEASDESD